MSHDTGTPALAFAFPPKANYGRFFLTASGTVEVRFERRPDGTVEVTAWPDMRLTDDLEISSAEWVGPLIG